MTTMMMEVGGEVIRGDRGRSQRQENALEHTMKHENTEFLDWMEIGR